MIANDPLTDDQLDWLNEALLNRIDDDADTQDKDEGIIEVSGLDGYLTAIVSSPVTLLPSRWLPAMWGDFEPVWESVDDYQTFISLLMQYSNSIAGMLIHCPDDFEPMFYERNVEDQTYTIVDEWCEGYLRGVRLAEGAWRAGAS